MTYKISGQGLEPHVSNIWLKMWAPCAITGTVVNYEVYFSQHDSRSLSLCHKRRFNNLPFKFSSCTHTLKTSLCGLILPFKFARLPWKRYITKSDMIISTSLKFGFAEGELVVIPSLPPEPKICLQDLFENFNWLMRSLEGEFNAQVPLNCSEKDLHFWLFSFW